jgi:LmbE family N-acetylglucosaminyl deacetylase
MRFNNPTASVFVPDGKMAEEAYKRTTHLGIGAHQDDLEIMAFHGIQFCYQNPRQWFGGIICTDGSGSTRAGSYTAYNNKEIRRLRKKEQEKAASLGKYSFVVQLDYPSSAVRDPNEKKLEEDLLALLSATRASVIYTHNLADKHETHIGTVIAVIYAIRRLPLEMRPKKIFGCEVWRGLDWMVDEDKIALNVSDVNGLGKALVNVFDSQITGGKRYDLAIFGRWQANATYYQSHEKDDASQLLFAMDLSPLVADDPPDILDYINTHIQRFQQDVENKLKRRIGRST